SAPAAAVQSDSARSAVAQTDRQTPPPQKPLYQRLSPNATRIGMTFIVGFLIGWAFRVFLKMMTVIAVLGGAIFFGLSYFNVMNVDFSKVEKKFDTSKGWVTDQAWRLKDAVMSHIPSSGASLAGMLVGFRRKV